MSQAGTNHGSQIAQSQHGVDQEPTPSKISQHQNDDDFKKMMRHFLKEDRETYFQELARQGANLPPNFNVEDIITHEEETPIMAMMK